MRKTPCSTNLPPSWRPNGAPHWRKWDPSQDHALQMCVNVPSPRIPLPPGGYHDIRAAKRGLGRGSTVGQNGQHEQLISRSCKHTPTCARTHCSMRCQCTYLLPGSHLNRLHADEPRLQKTRCASVRKGAFWALRTPNFFKFRKRHSRSPGHYISTTASGTQ